MRRLAVAFSLFLAACAGGRETPVSDTQLGSLVQGQTTRGQAVALLGEPAETRAGKDGVQLVYAWRLGQTNSVSALPTAGASSAMVEVQRREIVLSFDGGGVLRDIERINHTTRNGAMNMAAPPGS